MPYDEELISFLRRLDKDDDGVITIEELDEFLRLIPEKKEAIDNVSEKVISMNKISTDPTTAPTKAPSVGKNRYSLAMTSVDQFKKLSPNRNIAGSSASSYSRSNRKRFVSPSKSRSNSNSPKPFYYKRSGIKSYNVYNDREKMISEHHNRQLNTTHSSKKKTVQVIDYSPNFEDTDKRSYNAKRINKPIIENMIYSTSRGSKRSKLSKNSKNSKPGSSIKSRRSVNNKKKYSSSKIEAINFINPKENDSREKINLAEKKQKYKQKLKESLKNIVEKEFENPRSPINKSVSKIERARNVANGQRQKSEERSKSVNKKFSLKHKSNLANAVDIENNDEGVTPY